MTTRIAQATLRSQLRLCLHYLVAPVALACAALVLVRETDGRQSLVASDGAKRATVVASSATMPSDLIVLVYYLVSSDEEATALRASINDDAKSIGSVSSLRPTVWAVDSLETGRFFSDHFQTLMQNDIPFRVVDLRLAKP